MPSHLGFISLPNPDCLPQSWIIAPFAFLALQPDADVISGLNPVRTLMQSLREASVNHTDAIAHTIELQVERCFLTRQNDSAYLRLRR